jgi:hypothetical protein
MARALQSSIPKIPRGGKRASQEPDLVVPHEVLENSFASESFGL